MPRIPRAWFIAFHLAGCVSTASRETPASEQVYDAVAEILIQTVEESWGTPREWGIMGPDSVTSLTLDERLLSDSFPRTDVGSLPRDWIERQLRVGRFQATCTRADPSAFCERGATTMVVRLSPVKWVTADSAEVSIMMNRELFGSEWRTTVLRENDAWRVVERKMLSIT